MISANRSLTRLLLVALPASIAAQGTPTPQGWMIGWKTVTDSGSNGGRYVLTTRAEVLDGKMRLTSEMSGTGRTRGQGTYAIFDTLAHTAMNVSPSSRRASIVNTTAFGGVAGIAKFEVVGEPTLDVHDLGPGEPILGYATRHYRYTTAYSTMYTIGDSTCTRRLTNSTETWVAPDLMMSPHGISADIMRMTIGSSPLAGAGFVDKVDPLIQSKMKGTALKTIVTRPNSMIPGDSANIVTTTDVTELAHGVDPSVFEIPVGFQLRDMRETKVDTVGVAAEIRSKVIARMAPMLCGGNR